MFAVATADGHVLNARAQNKHSHVATAARRSKQEGQTWNTWQKYMEKLFYMNIVYISHDQLLCG